MCNLATGTLTLENGDTYKVIASGGLERFDTALDELAEALDPNYSHYDFTISELSAIGITGSEN